MIIFAFQVTLATVWKRFGWELARRLLQVCGGLYRMMGKHSEKQLNLGDI